MGLVLADATLMTAECKPQLQPHLGGTRLGQRQLVQLQRQLVLLLPIGTVVAT
jgi:hypothetical protein